MSLLLRMPRWVLVPGLSLRIWYRKVEMRYLCWHAVRKGEKVDQLPRYVWFRFKQAGARVTAIRSMMLNGPGYAVDANGQTIEVCWNAPIALLIYIDNRPHFGLGVELRGEAVCIRQIQGVRGIRVSDELKSWPELLVYACMDYALNEQFREVRIYKANQEIGFEYPDFSTSSTLDYETRVKTHQDRMRRRYDRTAEESGFKKRKRYYFWQCTHKEGG